MDLSIGMMSAIKSLAPFNDLYLVAKTYLPWHHRAPRAVPSNRTTKKKAAPRRGAAQETIVDCYSFVFFFLPTLIWSIRQSSHLGGAW